MASQGWPELYFTDSGGGGLGANGWEKSAGQQIVLSKISGGLHPPPHFSTNGVHYSPPTCRPSGGQTSPENSWVEGLTWLLKFRSSSSKSTTILLKNFGWKLRKKKLHSKRLRWVLMKDAKSHREAIRKRLIFSCLRTRTTSCFQTTCFSTCLFWQKSKTKKKYKR